MTAPTNLDCTCWNPARPMPTRERHHEPVCPIERERLRANDVARRMILEATRRVTKV